MRENYMYYAKRIALLAACGAISILVMGQFGCTNDSPSQANNPNGVSAPVDPQENTTYTVAKHALVLGGVDGNGVPDDEADACDFTVHINGFPYVVDAEVELRWNASDYPDAEVCFAGSGVTWTYASGVHKLKAYTDAYGTAHFRVAGRFSGTISCSNPDSHIYRTGRIFVDGQELTAPSGGWFLVATADLGYAGGVNEEDIEELEEDIACSQYYFSRSDLDGSGATNNDDRDILESIIIAGGSTATCNAE